MADEVRELCEELSGQTGTVTFGSTQIAKVPVPSGVRVLFSLPNPRRTISTLVIGVPEPLSEEFGACPDVRWSRLRFHTPVGQ
jgi:hypothetical protein